MKLFIDSSIFLKLLLDEPGADKTQAILENIESNRIIGFITPMILEEVTFKLIYAKMSELLETSNIWRIRETLRHDDEKRRICVETVKEFRDYVNYMYTRGLRIEPVTFTDWLKAIDIIDKYGLLPADAIHVVIALRLGVKAIATFDEDFKYVREINTIP